MTRMALRGLLARKLRTALTGFAVVIGVAFVAGTFIFTDTINASFDDLFKRVSKGVDVSVTARQVVEGDFGGRVQPLPAGVLQKIEDTPGVEAAEPRFQTQVTVFGKDGDPIGGNGPPSIVFSQSEERFDPNDYVEGGPAGEPGEVTLDKATADREGFQVGDRLRIAGRAPVREYTLSGITKLGDQNSLGIVSMTMPLAEVQALADRPDTIDEVAVAADGGTSPEAVKAAIIRSVGPGVTVRTGEEQAEKQASDISESLGFLRIGLLVFAGVAVLVIGFVASVLGILGGMVLAPALRALMASLGIDLPSTGTVVAPRTIIVGLAVGMLATLVSGLIPARRATQVQPVEAMREAGTPGARRLGRLRLIASFATVALGIVVLVVGLVGSDGSAAAALLGLGVVLMIFGVAMLAPVLVRPLARVIGAPLERLQGMPGRLARENAERQPQRTAITASALMIGLSIVVFTTIFAAGLSHSIDKVLDEQFSRTALIVTHDDGFSPVPPQVAERLQGMPGVETVSPMRFDQANVRGGGDSVPATGVDPATITRVFSPALVQGGPDALAGLRDDQMLADNDWAKDHGFAVGDRVQVTTPKDVKVEYTVAGTYDNQAGGLGQFVVTNASMTKAWDQPDDAFILVSGRGSPETLEREAKATLREFPIAKAQTLAQFKDESADQVNQLLGLVYALLSLSVIVALLGIVNTLALAVHERTRELGLLRAVGMSKRQVR